jgi:hypothetical protein
LKGHPDGAGDQRKNRPFRPDPKAAGRPRRAVVASGPSPPFLDGTRHSTGHARPHPPTDPRAWPFRRRCGSCPLRACQMSGEREARPGKGPNGTRTGREGGGTEPATADGAPPRGDRRTGAARALKEKGGTGSEAPAAGLASRARRLLHLRCASWTTNSSAAWK